MKHINIFFLLLLAPLAGLLLLLNEYPAQTPELDKHLLILPLEEMENEIHTSQLQVAEVQKSVGLIELNLEEQQQQFEEQEKLLQALAEKSRQQKNLSDAAFDRLILARLGAPLYTEATERIELKVFATKKAGFRGYAAKVKLFDKQAVQVVLSKDTLGAAETTSEAVERTGALLGINGGGFYKLSQKGEEYTLPIGTTMVDGSFVGDFQPSHDQLFFSGFTSKGELIGGIFKSKEKLLSLNPKEGVSFVPILLREYQPLSIPDKWQQKKEPRTVIAQYANGDLLLMVIDGRQTGWSTGVTLEQLQILLLELGVREAYNLDGGGSSTFVFEDKVLNKPSDGKERPVATHILVLP